MGYPPVHDTTQEWFLFKGLALTQIMVATGCSVGVADESFEAVFRGHYGTPPESAQQVAGMLMGSISVALHHVDHFVIEAKDG